MMGDCFVIASQRVGAKRRPMTGSAKQSSGPVRVRRLDCFVATLLAMTVLAFASPVRAQDAGTLKKDMIGQWELSTTERSKTCVVTLKGDASPQGMKLELEPGCAAALPFTRDITAWSIKGLGDIVRLQDAAGQPVIDFTEVESGIFEGLRTNEGVYILQNLAAARSLAKSMDQMIGDWSMVRGSGQTICGLTLTNTEATADNFQVFLKPKCDPAIAAFAPTQWRLDRGQMVLMNARGETWQFEADDNAQWRRVPDSVDPLILLRQ
jgi:Protease inhibitor Inh